VPFLFYTSFRGTIAQDHPGIVILDKPTEPDRLVSELEKLDIRPRIRPFAAFRNGL
jgi:hypothetical protein